MSKKKSLISANRINFILLIVFIFVIGLAAFTLSRNYRMENNSNLGVVYSYMSYSTKSQSWNEQQGYVSNLTNTSKTPFDIKSSANFYSPSRHHSGKLTEKTFSISSNTTPSTFNTIIDISHRNDVLSLDKIFWSPDEKTIAYELRIHQTTGNAASGTLQVYSEAQYYTINIDGTNNQLIGKIPNFPGGFMLGYDFTNSTVYLTRSNFGKVENKTIIAFNTKAKTQKELLTVSRNVIAYISSNYKYMYYSLDNKIITEMNLQSGSIRQLFDIVKGTGSPSSIISFFGFGRGNSLLFLEAFDQSQSYKLIFNTQTNNLDKTLSDPLYKEFTFYVLSPDYRYIFLTTRVKSMEANDPNLNKYGEYSFYSGKYCIWDIQQKKIIPFFNCKLSGDKFVDEKINEDIAIYRWVVNK